MKPIIIVAMSMAVLATAKPLVDRSAGPCFHKGSDAICCDQTGDQVIITGCSAPNGSTSTPDDFRATCKSAGLHAYCCAEGNSTEGFVCAPVPKKTPTKH